MGRNKLTDKLVSNIIIVNEYVILEYPDNIAAAPRIAFC
jgi:hypothetical protein